jgi:SAM-dependent methyltransferase
MNSDATQAAYHYALVANQTETQLVQLMDDYFDDESSDYDTFDEDIKRRSLYLEAVEKYVVRALQNSNDLGRVLSFGCGTGRRESKVAKEAGLRVEDIVGIERSKSMRNIATSRGLKTYESIDAAMRNIGEASVDAAICLYSFIHLPSRSSRLSTLQGIAHLLRPGAPLIIDVFNLDDRHEWPSKISDGGSGTRPPTEGTHKGDILYSRRGRSKTSYMHYFTLGEFCSVLEEGGFVITDLVAVGHGHKPGHLGVPLDEGCLLANAKTRI